MIETLDEAPQIVPNMHLGVPTVMEHGEREQQIRSRLAGTWEVDAQEQGGGALDATAWNLGELMVVSGEYPRRKMRRTLPMLRADQIDHYALALPLEGEQITAQSNSHTETVSTGEPLMTDLGQEMAADAAGGRFLLTLIPRESIDDLLPRPLDLHVTPLRGGSARLLTGHLRSFADHLPAMGVEEAKGVATATLHLIVASLTNCPDVLAGGRRGVETSQIRQACRYIELHVKETELGASDICAALRLSRATVYRLFERYGGVAKYIKERRLMRIHGELAERKRKSIALIADEYGYPNAAQFSRAFREQFGYSPRDVGSSAQSGQARVDGADGHDFSSWVRTLRS